MTQVMVGDFNGTSPLYNNTVYTVWRWTCFSKEPHQFLRPTTERKLVWFHNQIIRSYAQDYPASGLSNDNMQTTNGKHVAHFRIICLQLSSNLYTLLLVFPGILLLSRAFCWKCFRNVQQCLICTAAKLTEYSLHRILVRLWSCQNQAPPRGANAQVWFSPKWKFVLLRRMLLSTTA